tara:strand:- start:40 stop:231 length:192 start_codon:yes stop_codon:yes gene_type:complete
LVVSQFNACAMHFHHGFHQRKTKTISGCGSAFFQPVKPAQNVGALVLGNARSAIGNPELRHIG